MAIIVNIRKWIIENESLCDRMKKKLIGTAACDCDVSIEEQLVVNTAYIEAIIEIFRTTRLEHREVNNFCCFTIDVLLLPSS